ncbi:hypothetical protein AXG93_3571s1060 [Marchantia polymorpha subsp. ruderalis]|uniref:Reverse transcriptase Ty1/copia-type domain-containing protein n=1 Tax=Marchantia polymorpha subsp. ruderalis TaxID=1480154 RepID=A0A176VRL1_MARPO|nr:hypothetical protein AXG93_3571s1060 [Marchantia polymorpha subsp. ruderalis]
MLFEAGLPKRFWEEAVNTAAYLINRCTSVALNCNTLVAPKLDNLKVFGCVVYMHQREYKLDPRAKKCMFVRYPEGVKEAKDSAEVAKERAKIEMKLLGRCSNEREDKDDASDDGHLEEIEELSGESHDKSLDSYQLARDRHKRETRAPKRFGYSDLVAFALVAAEELEDLEPRLYREAVMSKDKELWKCAMEE